MKVHDHARARMIERGAGEDEIVATIGEGERSQAKIRPSGFPGEFAV